MKEQSVKNLAAINATLPFSQSIYTDTPVGTINEVKKSRIVYIEKPFNALAAFMR